MRWINQQSSGIRRSLKQSSTAASFVIARPGFVVLMMTALLGSTPAFAQHNAANPQPQAVKSSFDIERINEPVVKEFQNAWRLAGRGASAPEAVVLIFK